MKRIAAIVTIASTRAKMSEPNTESYSASKGGLVALTHALAISLGPEGRVNCVSPGATKTARFEATRVVDPQKMDSSIKSLIRYGEPDEMADAVAFLAGPRSKYISGQVLRVDGGETLFPG